MSRISMSLKVLNNNGQGKQKEDTRAKQRYGHSQLAVDDFRCGKYLEVPEPPHVRVYGTIALRGHILTRRVHVLVRRNSPAWKDVLS